MKKLFSVFFFHLFLIVIAQRGNTLKLNGEDSYMRIPHHQDFNFSGKEEFSVTLWLKADSYGKNTRLVSKRPYNDYGIYQSGYELFGLNSSELFFAVNTPNLLGENVFSQWGNIKGKLNKWVHWAFVVSRKNGKTMIRLYQNGKITNQKEVEKYAVDNTNPVLIGLGERGNRYFSGEIDNLRFYRKALSEKEIQRDMKSEINPNTPFLIAGYDFEMTENAVAYDITGKHNAQLYNILPDKIGIIQNKDFAGRGNKNENVLKIIYKAKENTTLEELVFSASGTTDLADIEKIKFYSTGKNKNFDNRKTSEYQLLGETNPKTGDISLKINAQLEKGENYLWLTYDISENVREGNKIDAVLKLLKINGKTQNIEKIGNPQGSREILLKKILVFAPNDEGSKNYRIPAIITANDGSLVVINDKRKNHERDLPADIDVVSKRSIDGGFTWSDTKTIAKGSENYGYGDPLVFKAKSGKLVVLFVGGVGFHSSTAENPIRMYKSESLDNGISWATPKDITAQIYGTENNDKDRKEWDGVFFSSGQGLTMSNGRLAGVLVMRKGKVNYHQNPISNYVVYSDDEGETWQVSDKALTRGDEAKLVELNNGDVLLSSRGWHRVFNVSKDKGLTWGKQGVWKELSGNPTNGDMIRYTSTLQGSDKDRILHSIPIGSDRANVRIFISYDEGQSWRPQRIISPTKSAYSSLTILPDGTIGAYVEEDDTIPYKLYFLNFSLEWLTEGKDRLK